MYWNLRCLNPDYKLSYAIVKHPDTVFERSLGTGRDIVAKFDEDIHKGYVKNDPLEFLKTARKMNLSNYVHVQLSGVCPHNLEGFQETYRSSIRGKCPSGITEDEFNSLEKFEVIIGPFPKSATEVTDWFEEAGFHVEIKFVTREEFITPIAILTNKEPSTLTTVLQKVYLISYYLTMKYALTWIDAGKVEKFATLSASWINKLLRRNSLINKLCKHDKSIIEKFELTIIDKTENTEEELDEKLSSIETFIEKQRLHDLRHKMIVAFTDRPSVNTVIELGCGGGKLLKKLSKSIYITSLIGIEKDSRLVEKCSRVKNSHTINSDITIPRIKESSLKPDFIICTEVIEHMNLDDRIELINLFKCFYLPKEFIITVPNFEFNKNYPRLAGGGYRHPDHKIEYTKDQLFSEIIKPLEVMYDINIIDIEPEDNICPTWFLHGVHKKPEGRIVNKKVYDKILSYYDSVYLPISNYTIRKNEISAGLTNRAFSENSDNIFYMAPTMAPVDFNGKYPEFLEHPETAFDYYRERGQQVIYAEEKYMGSRATIIAFRNSETAKLFNSKELIIINSRSGFKFFDESHQDTVDQIYKEMISFMNLNEWDFAAIDCEILPWKLKGEKLIFQEFQVPGMCTYLSRKFGGYQSEESAKKFLDVLENYSKDEPVSVRAFDVLLTGSIGNNGKISTGYIGHHITRHDTYKILAAFSGYPNSIIKPVTCYWINVNDQGTRDHATLRWQEFCKNGGEGFVFKPDTPYKILSNGYLLQPALKVRGRDYLRLIYGIDYLETDYFNIVCRRSTKKKRILSIQEFELSNSILKSYNNQNKIMREKLVAAFIGMDSINYSTIDATL